MDSQSLWKKLCLMTSAVLLVSMVIGCSSSNNDDNGTPVVLPDAPGSEAINVSGRIVLGSSANGAGEGVAGATVSIKGDHKDSVVDGSGKKTSQFTTDESGLVGFHLRGVEQSDFPVKLKVVATHPDYESTGTTVSITKNGDVDFSISLVDMSTPPQGVVAKSVPAQSDDSGRASGDIQMESGTDTNSGGSASMIVPDGTVMKDAAGQPVTGSLTATAVYYNNQDEAALETFPGGLTGVEVDNGNSSETVTFISGSFSSFSIKNEDGQHVKNFSSPVTFKLRVPKTTINPQTGVAVAVNDDLPVWSYDPDTGEWQKEGVGIVQDDGNEDTFYVEVQTDHLSYWNLDWPAETCISSEQWSVPGGEGHNIKLKVVGSGYSVDTYTRGDSFVRYWNAPKNIPVTIVATLSDIEVGRKEGIENICDGGSIPITLPQGQQFADVTVSVYQMCEEDNSVIAAVPSAPVYFGDELIGSTDEDGKVVAVKRMVPKNYKVRAYNRIDGTWLSKSVDVTAQSSVSFAIPIDCSSVTGGDDVTGGSGAG